jgi:glycosyltransferase involved in cell wall biosynthesis
MKKLALLVLNDLVNDSRVLKEAYSLSELFEVHIFALNSGNLPKIEILNERIYVHRMITYVKPINIVYKKISQIVAYLRFLITSVFYIKKFQGVHCNDLETLPVGYVLKFLNRDIRLIYDAHEYETETLWMKNKLKKSLAKFFEGLFLKRVDLVITVSDSIAEAYVKDYGIKRPAVVLNAPRFKEVKKKNLFRIKFPIKESHTIFLYQGGFTEGRGIDILIDTFKNIKSNNAVIVFMGFGPLLDKIMIASKYSKNIL